VLLFIWTYYNVLEYLGSGWSDFYQLLMMHPQCRCAMSYQHFHQTL